MIRTSNHMITLPIPSTNRNIPCFYRAWCPHLPEMFGDGRGWREHQAPRGAHSPREVGSVSQHRRGLAAARRVVGAVFGRSRRDVTHGGGAVLNCNRKCLSGETCRQKVKANANLIRKLFLVRASNSNFQEGISNESQMSKVLPL